MFLTYWTQFLEIQYLKILPEWCEIYHFVDDLFVDVACTFSTYFFYCVDKFFLPI